MPIRIDYLYYPFLCTPKDMPRLFYKKPSLIAVGSPEIVDKTMNTLRSIVEKSEIDATSFTDQEESVLVYNTIVEITKLIGDKRISNKIALAYSKLASRRLQSENDENLVAIANKLGLDANYETVNFPKIPTLRERRLKMDKTKTEIEIIEYKYSVPLREYLEIISTRLIHDQSYSLVNVFLLNGRVFLDKHSFARVIEERSYQYIIKEIEELETEISPELERLVQVAKDMISRYYEKMIKERAERARDKPLSETMTFESSGVLLQELLPPCIKKIIDTLNMGGNPSHHERFNLAAFLGNIGFSVDEILEYFKKTADFKERIARYQVEHILGMRGSKIKYKPYNCDRMKSTNICPITEQCPGGKNPLAIYKYNLRINFKNKKRREEATGEREAAGGI